MKQASILIVEDDPLQRKMLATLLQRKLDFQSQEAENGRIALDILEQHHATIKIVIMDIDMPIMGGLEALKIIHQKYPAIPVIMLTGSRDIDDVITAMKHGATDFLTKPYQGERMAVTVQNALKISTLTKEVSRLRSETKGTLTFEHLIGHDAGLMPVINTARKAAASDIPILITGETGTGKEVFCKAIHGESTRAGQPFIAVNCGAIPAQLVESTLFGHEKGAFTGATEKAIGKFREAEGGTIFLDEVGELPLDAQVKLLRVLQQKEVEPVGAGKPVSVNIRVISATNRDLQDEVKQGRFREDLFFRLNVLQIDLPPLRARKHDIPALAHHFIERFCINEGGVPKDISAATLKTLAHHNWPGNVRQLENTINRAMVMSEGRMLDLEHFTDLETQSHIATSGVGAGVGAAHDDIDGPSASYARDIRIVSQNGAIKTIEEIEKEAMQIALNHHDHNITQSAKALGMAKSTFYKKMKTQS